MHAKKINFNCTRFCWHRQCSYFITCYEYIPSENCHPTYSIDRHSQQNHLQLKNCTSKDFLAFFLGGASSSSFCLLISLFLCRQLQADNNMVPSWESQFPVCSQERICSPGTSFVAITTDITQGRGFAALAPHLWQ